MKTIVLTLRGFHLGYLSCYGNQWISTPALDDLAAEGVTFVEHYIDVPDPRLTEKTWRSGSYHFPKWRDDLPAKLEADLLTELQERKVATYLVTQSEEVASTFGKGFQTVTLIEEDDSEPALERALDNVLDLLTSLQESEWLLWVDLHIFLPPWQVAEEILGLYFEDEEPEVTNDKPEAQARGEQVGSDEDELESDEFEEDLPPTEPWFDPPIGPLENKEDDLLRLQDTYSAVISYFDAALATLMEYLDTLELKDDTLLVLTSDQGFPLGEHGHIGPQPSQLHEELTHIPLVMRIPMNLEQRFVGDDKEHIGSRVLSFTQSIDLMPTLLDAHDIERPEEVQGRSLFPLVFRQMDRIREQAYVGVQFEERNQWLLRTNDWAFHYTQPSQKEEANPALYLKPDDRWEVNNLVQQELVLAEEFENTLREVVVSTFTGNETESAQPGD